MSNVPQSTLLLCLQTVVRHCGIQGGIFTSGFSYVSGDDWLGVFGYKGQPVVLTQNDYTKMCLQQAEAAGFVKKLGEHKLYACGMFGGGETRPIVAYEVLPTARDMVADLECLEKL